EAPVISAMRLAREVGMAVLSSCPGLPSPPRLRRPSEFVARRSLGGDGTRASTSLRRGITDVDGRDKPGHERKEAFGTPRHDALRQLASASSESCRGWCSIWFWSVRLVG